MAEICNECGRSVATGSGLLVNRVPDGNDAKTRSDMGKPYPEGDFVCRDCETMANGERFCDNPVCENKAVECIPVSVNRPYDGVRYYCYPCWEAYIVGVQHGRMISGDYETTIAKGL